jgi:hypothetical protein
MTMLNFIEKLFKKESFINYTIAVYTPPKSEHASITPKKPSHHRPYKPHHDEMEIDNLYQKN